MHINHIITKSFGYKSCLCFWRNTSHERERLSAKINLLLSPKNNAGYAKNPSQHPEFKNERVRVPPPDLQQLPNKQEHQ